MGHETSDTVADDEAVRRRIVADVEVRGVQPVALALGVSRGGLASYLCHRERAGTRLMIEVQGSIYYGIDDDEAAP